QTHCDNSLPRAFLYTYEDGSQVIACESETLVAILSLYIVALLFGEVFNLLRLPPLLGTLTAGLFYRFFSGYILEKPFKSYLDFDRKENSPNSTVRIQGKMISLACACVTDSKTSGFIRKIALGAILTRAGLSVDLKKVAANLRMTCILSFLPCTMEGLSIMGFSMAIVGWPASWGALLGFVVAGVSPAIIVPNLLKLDFAGWGSDQGVASTLITASSVDDVIAILGYTVAVALVTSSQAVTAGIIFTILSLIPVGLAIGGAGGLLLWVIPPKHMFSRNGFLIQLSFEMMVFFIIGMEMFGFEGSGPIACMTSAIVAQLGWSLGFPSRISSHTLNETKTKHSFIDKLKGETRLNERRKSYLMEIVENPLHHKETMENQLKTLQKAYQKIWIALEPMMFVLIGFQVDIVGVLKGKTGNLIFVFLLGLLMRFFGTILTATKSGLNWKEKIFLGIAWLPKATVPAALGSEAYRVIMNMNPTEEEKQRADQIVSIAVLAILIAAPLGAFLIPILGPRLLKNTSISVDKDPKKKDHHPETIFEEENESSVNFNDQEMENGSDGSEKIACESESLVAILSLFLIAILFAELFSVFHLPPLLGMITAGLFYRLFTSQVLKKPFTSHFDLDKNETLVENVERLEGKLLYLACASVTNSESSSFIRKLALGAILTRSGLSIDLKKVAANFWMTCILSFLPCITEGLSIMVFALIIVGWPVSWGALLGFVVAGVSPAVIAASLLKLDFEGWGSDKGIASTLITASSVDDVVAILGYTLSVSMVTSIETISVASVFQMLSLIPVGLATGVAGGLLLWIFPPKHMYLHEVFLVLISFEMMTFFIICMEAFRYDSSGPIACLTSAIVAQVGWSLGFPGRLTAPNIPTYRFPLPILTKFKGKSKTSRRPSLIVTDDLENIDEGCKQLVILDKAYELLWTMLEPMMFVLIGYQVDIVAVVKGHTGNLIWVFLLGLMLRFATTLLAATKSGLNWKEKIFLSVAWLPKATVPAALGSEAYAAIMKMNPTQEEKQRAEQILAIAVLSILIAAPIGALFIPILGPRCLQKSKTHMPRFSKSSANEIYEDPIS
ncbi:Sodium/hydrogen exchanger 9B2, partial [Cichlidogyrus casuarinus]